MFQKVTINRVSINTLFGEALVAHLLQQHRDARHVQVIRNQFCFGIEQHRPKRTLITALDDLLCHILVVLSDGRDGINIIDVEVMLQYVTFLS